MKLYIFEETEFIIINLKGNAHKNVNVSEKTEFLYKQIYCQPDQTQLRNKKDILK